MSSYCVVWSFPLRDLNEVLCWRILYRSFLISSSHLPVTFWSGFESPQRTESNIETVVHQNIHTQRYDEIRG